MKKKRKTTKKNKYCYVALYYPPGNQLDQYKKNVINAEKNKTELKAKKQKEAKQKKDEENGNKYNKQPKELEEEEKKNSEENDDFHVADYIDEETHLQNKDDILKRGENNND